MLEGNLAVDWHPMGGGSDTPRQLMLGNQDKLWLSRSLTFSFF